MGSKERLSVERDDVRYFSIYQQGTLVGQILLQWQVRHDE